MKVYKNLYYVTKLKASCSGNRLPSLQFRQKNQGDHIFVIADAFGEQQSQLQTYERHIY